MSLHGAPRRLIPKRLARYAVSAGAAAIVDLGGFALLIALDLPVLPAAALSFLVASVVNYTLSARFVFSSKPTLRRYPLFLTAASAGFAINVGVTTLAARAFGIPSILAKMVGIGTAFLANFVLNAVVVFATASKRDGADQ